MGSVALERTAGVGRHAAAVVQDLDGGRGQADIDLFVDEAVGDAVGVAGSTRMEARLTAFAYIVGRYSLYSLTLSHE